ncbi:MAG: phage integrase SAM-like domain-containing protein [Winogradskyella arenosi]
MATLKLTLDKRRIYSDGRSPLIMRLTANKKSTSIHLGVKIFDKEWDAKKLRVLKKHANCHDLNLHIKNTQLEYEQKLREIETRKPEASLKELKHALTTSGLKDEVLFYDFGIEQAEKLKMQSRFGNAQSYITAINSVVNFGGKSLKLSDIDYAFVLEYDAHLSASGISVNGAAAYLRALRALLNRAGKLEVYNMSKYPFRNFKIRSQKTVSRAVPIASIKKINHIELEKKSEQFHARNVFMLIFGLIGISFMDLVLLKKSNLKNGRIIYKRSKTGKLYSIKVSPLVNDILNYYSDDNSDFLLPQFGLDNVKEAKIRHHVNLGLKSTNRYLKQIGETLQLDIPLTTYVARYSWANIAKANGYSKDLIAEALGHSYGNHVTGIYLEGYGNEVIDQANERLITLIN